MARNILIAGTESPLFNAAVAEAGKRTESLAQLKPPEWRMGSSLSAGSQILHVRNMLGRIDEAVFVSAPPADIGAASALSLPQIDDIFDNQLKSWFFLLREVAAVFDKQNGSSADVEADTAPAARCSLVLLLEQSRSLASSLFQALGDNLLSATAAFDVYAYINETEGPRDSAAFADFVFKNLDASMLRARGGAGGSKRWVKFGKSRFFGSLYK